MLAAVVLPFIALLLLSLVFRRPLWQAATASFALSLLLWSLGAADPSLLAPSARALILACEVGLILFGAITFLEYMNATGTTDRIRRALAASTDRNPALDALLLAWLFCGFLEGAAGFGAPAALVAPLLASLGFPPLLAAVLPLIGDSAAVPFGAVGTPVRIGLAGLPAETAGVYGAGLNLAAGLVAPLAIVWLAPPSPSANRKRLYLLGVWAGLCFTVPAFLVSFVGPEFPSLAGALVGLILFSATLSAKSGWRQAARLPVALAPYLLVCGALLLGKIALSTRRVEFLVADTTIGFSAFQPGLVFLLVMGLLALWRRDKTWSQLRSYMAVALRPLPLVWLAILCLAGMAQLMVFNLDLTGLTSEGGGLSSGPLARGGLILLAPVAGALGAFVAGSATVACLLVGPFLAQAAEITGVAPGLVLGLTLVGAGAGNMISLQNLAAVQATVGLVDQERPMLARLWIPCVAYVIVAGASGLLLWSVSAALWHTNP